MNLPSRRLVGCAMMGRMALERRQGPRALLGLMAVTAVASTSGCLAAASADAVGDITKCTQTPLAGGSLSHAAGELSFDTADTFSEVGFSDADGNKRCVNEVDLTVSSGTSCSMQILSAPVASGKDGQRIESLVISVNESSCPDWGLPSGTYQANRANGEIGTIVAGGERISFDFCIDADITVEFESFTATGSQDVQFSGGTVEVSGPLDVNANLDDCPA